MATSMSTELTPEYLANSHFDRVALYAAMTKAGIPEVEHDKHAIAYRTGQHLLTFYDRETVVTHFTQMGFPLAALDLSPEQIERHPTQFVATAIIDGQVHEFKMMADTR